MLWHLPPSTNPGSLFSPPGATRPRGRFAMKRIRGWIITWLAAVCLLLSFAPVVHRGDHSRDAREKRSGGCSTEFSSWRILPAGGTIWIPNRASLQKSSPVSDVFLTRITNDILAPGPVWLNRRGPPRGHLRCSRGCAAAGRASSPNMQLKHPSRREFARPLTVKTRKATFATAFS